ncbi:MAG: c-type cytochrome [Chloroflexi bacterium]|nr:c-type cytochrome [Chloroflexota bacterium]
MLSGRTVNVRKSVLLRYGLSVVLGAVALAALGWLLWRDATSGPSDAEVAAILQTQLGGDTTVISTNRNSFAPAAANLNSRERLTFEIGDSFFTQNWVTAPASTEARDGLGPTFNAQSCSSCHTLDGRAQPPADNDDPERGLLFRFSIPGVDPDTGGPLPDPVYGGQLQDRAILTVPPEGRFLISYREVPGTYEDGTPYTLLQPEYSFADLAFGPTHPDLLFSPRIAPAVFGGGLLEAIPEADILARADPDDANGDGISGRANMVWSVRDGDTRMGRFGWKANVPTLEQQIAGAFHGDIGITSPLFEGENCPPSQTDCQDALNGGVPEIPAARLAKVLFYNRTLGVPAMRDVDDPQVREGARLFLAAGCAACHTPSHTTGEHPVPALAGQTIFPYTDLLLHDMGEGLADGRPDFLADGREWRTPPLWGIGLIENVNNHTRLLHDGRARDIAEAILWHDGEGLAAREEFRKMSREEREAVIRFLESL